MFVVFVVFFLSVGASFGAEDELSSYEISTTNATLGTLESLGFNVTESLNELDADASSVSRHFCDRISRYLCPNSCYERENCSGHCDVDTEVKECMACHWGLCIFVMVILSVLFLAICCCVSFTAFSMISFLLATVCSLPFIGVYQAYYLVRAWLRGRTKDMHKQGVYKILEDPKNDEQPDGLTAL